MEVCRTELPIILESCHRDDWVEFEVEFMED